MNLPYPAVSVFSTLALGFLMVNGFEQMLLMV